MRGGPYQGAIGLGPRCRARGAVTADDGGLDAGRDGVVDAGVETGPEAGPGEDAGPDGPPACTEPWQVETFDTAGMGLSLRLDLEGGVHVSAHDYNTDVVRYAFKPAAGAWDVATISTGGYPGQCTSLDLDLEADLIARSREKTAGKSELQILQSTFARMR